MELTFGEGFIRDQRRAGARGVVHEEGKKVRSGAEMAGAGLPRWRAWCGMRRNETE